MESTRFKGQRHSRDGRWNRLGRRRREKHAI